jgi:hypothetical protein
VEMPGQRHEDDREARQVLVRLSVVLTVVLVRVLVSILAIALFIGPPLLMKEVTHSMAVRAAFMVLWFFVGYPACIWLFFFSRWSKRTLMKTKAQPPEQQQDVDPAISPQAQEHPTSPPPGWYPDPTGAPGTRYWDASRWNLMAQPPAQ